MNLQIRRGIFETSSSSASAMVMVGKDCNHKTEVKLYEPFNILAFSYESLVSSDPIYYATNWADKLSLLVNKFNNSSYGLLKEVVENYTGQTFKVYTYGDVDENITFMNDIRKCEEIFDFSGIIDDCHLLGVEDLLELFNKNELDYQNVSKEFKWILEEIIFNEAIAIKLGGNGGDLDFNLAKPDTFEKTKPLSVAYPSAREALKNKNYSPYGWNVKNGNELLIIAYDGTKIRICKDEVAEPEYPETIDMKITDQCEHNCPFCYEGSTCDGKHGSLDYPFLKTIPNFVEIAVGGGNPLLHPQLNDVLKLSDIVNITIKDADYVKGCFDTIKSLKFNAVGVSVSNVETARFIGNQYYEIIRNCYYGNGEEGNEVEYFNDWYHLVSYSIPYSISKDQKIWHHVGLVVHVINGVVTKEMLEPLYDKGVKLLILGYKNKGRGKDYLENSEVKQNQQWLYDNLEEIVTHFLVTSFDVLALEQLDVKRFVSDEDWDHYYMGEDGTHSMYIDLVKGEFGISSTDDRRWPVMDDIRDMFKFVRAIVVEEKKNTRLLDKS